MDIIAIIVFLLLSAFFSGSEIAFISASKLGVELKKNSGSRRGRIIGDFYIRAESFLGTMLIGNNIALVAFTYFMTRILTGILPNMPSPFLLLLVITLIITIIVLIFGEFLPKTIFRLYSNQALFVGAYPLAFFRTILKPMTWMVISLSNLMLRYIFRQGFDKQDHSFSRHDLEILVTSAQSDAAEELDTNLFRNALNLKQVKIRDCMVPRTEIKHVDINAGTEELINSFRETSHSRIFVTDGDIDHVVGYLHHQSLYSSKGSLRKMMMDLPIVPEVLNVKDLLIKFTKERTSIACVVDEYGGTSGLITLEDVLEEIFGEIEDEHDHEDLIDQQLSDTEFLLSGRLEINYLNEKYPQLNFPDGDYVTLSGLLTSLSGKIPEQGSVLVMDGYRFRMELVSDKKIETVRVELFDSED